MSTPILHFDFFDRANQFRRAYRVLPNIGQPPEWPKYLLFYHAMELALKAYLIQQGVSEQVLKDEFGHDIKKLVDEAVKRGLPLPYGSQEMIAGLGGAPHQRRSSQYRPSSTDTVSAWQVSVLARAVRTLHGSSVRSCGERTRHVSVKRRAAPPAARCADTPAPGARQPPAKKFPKKSGMRSERYGKTGGTST